MVAQWRILKRLGYQTHVDRPLLLTQSCGDREEVGDQVHWKPPSIGDIVSP